MEVGVRVEAYAVGGFTRHIQSAYFTFVSPDENGNPLQLPKMMAINKVCSHCMFCVLFVYLYLKLWSWS